MKKPVLEYGSNMKTKKKSSNNLVYDNLEDSDSDIECFEIVEVKENRVKSFLPKDYRWMESSPFYRRKVWLACM